MRKGQRSARTGARVDPTVMAQSPTRPVKPMMIMVPSFPVEVISQLLINASNATGRLRRPATELIPPPIPPRSQT